MKYSQIFAITLLISLPLVASGKKKPNLCKIVRTFEKQSSQEAIANINTYLAQEHEDDELTRLHAHTRISLTSQDPLVGMHQRTIRSIAYHLIPIVHQMSGL
jgi:hypothetical protein